MNRQVLTDIQNVISMNDNLQRSSNQELSRKLREELWPKQPFASEAASLVEEAARRLSGSFWRKPPRSLWDWPASPVLALVQFGESLEYHVVELVDQNLEINGQLSGFTVDEVVAIANFPLCKEAFYAR